MKKYAILIILILIAGTGYYSYRIYSVKALPTIHPSRSEIDVAVFASGKTKADKITHLSFQNTGRITALAFKKNQLVKKGEIVATIDTSDLKMAKYIELQQYTKARKDFDQVQKDTYKDVPDSDTIRRAKEKAQADLNSTIANVEIADRAIKNASLYAPFDGIVTEVNGELNEWTSVFATKPLITIIDPNTVYFEAQIQEEDIGRMQAGQLAKLALDAYPNQSFQGTISEIDKTTVVNENGDTILPVKVMLSENLESIAVGLNGDASFVLDRRTNILTIPKRATVKRNDKNYVIVKRGTKTEEVPVEVGIADNKNIEIVKGVSESDELVMPSDLE